MFSLPAAVPPGSINTNIYASRPNREADRYLLREQRFQQQRMERMREQVAKEEKELQELQEKQKLAPKKAEDKDTGSLLGKKGNAETGKTDTAAKSASADLSASLARTTGTLGVGVRVVTSGLKAEMHNGKSAICLKFEAASGRWIVRIDETGEPAGLKPENLVVLSGKAEAAAKPAEKPIDETQEEFLKMQKEAKMKLTKGIHPDDLGRRHLSRVGPEKEDDRPQKRRFRERGQSRERRSRSRDHIAAGRSGEDYEATSDPYLPPDEKDKSSAARARRSSAGSTAAAAADSSRQRYDDDYSYYSERRCSWSRSHSPEELSGCRASRARGGGGGQGRRRRDDSREDAAGSYRRGGGGGGASPAGRGGAGSRSPSLSQDSRQPRRSERSSAGQRRARSRRGGADRRNYSSGGAAGTGGRRRGAD